MRKFYFSMLILVSFIACKSNNRFITIENNTVKNDEPISPNNQKLVASLEAQTKQTKSYNPAYVTLDYPNGDVDISTGVCADVIVRAFRNAGIDLQKEIHEDMKKSFSAYPNKWNLTAPDKNIDHRRVPNLMTFFERKGKAKTITNHPDDYNVGDIVAWKLDNGLLHIGMICDEKNEENIPVVIHNIGSGTKKANVLFSWQIIGHYRWFE